MPGKKEKKNGEKEDEKRKNRKQKGNPNPAEDPGPDRTERELLLIQLGYVTEQLESSQLRCEELVRQNEVLACQRGALEEEKKDMASYLKRCVMEKEAELEELMERQQDQNRVAERDRDELLVQHGRLSQDLQLRVEMLLAENESLVERLASLEDFQKQKVELMGELERMEKQLASQRAEHRDDVHGVEMKALMEKRRMEQQMECHLAAVAAEVEQQVEQKVPESTRRALQENREAEARFGQLSQHVEVLTEENAALRDRRSRLSVDVDVLQQMLSQTTRTSCVRKKVVEQLTEKCRQLQAEQRTWKQQMEDLQSQKVALQAQMEELRRDQESLAEQRRAEGAEISQLEAELQEERGRSFRMRSVMQEAAVTLRQALTEAPHGPDPDLDSLLGWRQLVEKLMEGLHERLRSAAAVDSGISRQLQLRPPEAVSKTGSSTSSMGTKTRTGTRTSTARLGSVRTTKR
ncbi:unnamed protein product [Ophioblennius macclurei]